MPRGQAMTLHTAWELARAWFAGRLEPAWQRPAVAEIQALFQRLGLTSSFWDLA